MKKSGHKPVSEKKLQVPGVDIGRLKAAKQQLFLAWWFTPDPKIAKSIYEEYLKVVRLINAQGN